MSNEIVISLSIVVAYILGLITASTLWYFITKRYVQLFDNLLDKIREQEYISNINHKNMMRPTFTDEQLAYIEALRDEQNATGNNDVG